MTLAELMWREMARDELKKALAVWPARDAMKRLARQQPELFARIEGIIAWLAETERQQRVERRTGRGETRT